MFAIFEKLKRRRRKSSKRLTVVKDRISKREKTKEARKTCKNNVELTEIKNRVLVYERTREYGRKHFPSESTEIENRIAERGEEAKDTRTYKEKYLTNKNLSIITDDESDSSMGRTFVGAKSREKRLERRSLDEYVIVGVQEKPATPNKKNASDDSDSESVKTRSNCCPKCCNNNTWYGVLKRKVLRANKISPCAITGTARIGRYPPLNYFADAIKSKL